MLFISNKVAVRIGLALTLMFGQLLFAYHNAYSHAFDSADEIDCSICLKSNASTGAMLVSETPLLVGYCSPYFPNNFHSFAKEFSCSNFARAPPLIV